MEKKSLCELLHTINENPNINSLIQSSPICHKIFDPDLKMQFMSNSGVVALKIDNVEDFYGQSFPPKSSPKYTRDIIKEHMGRATKGETSIAEYYFIVDNNKIWFRTSFTPVFDTDGKLMYVRVDSMDISSKKIAEEKLLSAKEESERANVSKSEFLSRMSHELRTPMNAILGFGQLLEFDTDEPLSKTQKNRVYEIQKAGKHLLELINEILDLSRIESGFLTLSIEDILLSNLIDDVLSLISPLGAKQNINIINLIPQEPDLLVQGDFTRLKQVLLNLMSNAVKYNKPGGSITLNCQKNDAGKICISISDTGEGISQDNLKQLFQPFNRMDAENSSVEGTGIGLTITKRLVELMNGNISVKSNPGMGSCFSIEIPEGNQLTMVRVDRVFTPVLKAPCYKEEQKWTLLYVEDNPANLKLVEQILQSRSDIKLLTAPQARLGIELARAHQPDMILMDINMAGMDGITAMKKLKKYEETSNIPVIAVSANAMESDIKKGLEVGFKSYITKPFDIPKFFIEIDRFLKSDSLPLVDSI
jgi:signal transduction histidine kinase/ActR/RegA family two-component response regulator